MRYEKECRKLFDLALQQLNLEKNKAKCNFESMPLLSKSGILQKLIEELQELNVEAITYSVTIANGQYDNFEYPLDEIFNEVGDVAACLVGIIAYVCR